MKIFSRIKKYFEPTVDLDHPVFGDLVHDGVGNSDDLWQTIDDIHFKPINGKISLTILAGPEGPGDEHVVFFETFEENYKSIVNQYSSVLVREYDGWFDVKSQKEIEDLFRFVGLTVPEDGNENNEWSMSFYPKEDQNHLFTLNISNGKAAGCSIDG